MIFNSLPVLSLGKLRETLRSNSLLVACHPKLEERRVADSQGFEPWKGLHPCRFSRPVHSTALPPLLRRLASVSHPADERAATQGRPLPDESAPRGDAGFTWPKYSQTGPVLSPAARLVLVTAVTSLRQALDPAPRCSSLICAY